MVIDTSALVAVLLDERDAPQLAAAIGHANAPLLSAASLVEASLVAVGRFGERGLDLLDELVRRSAISVVAVDAEQALVARQAFVAFGEGRHPAGLNFGDCFSYALAKTTGRPLLFKGEDFARTDVRAAAPVD